MTVSSHFGCLSVLLDSLETEDESCQNEDERSGTYRSERESMLMRDVSLASNIDFWCVVHKEAALQRRQNGVVAVLVGKQTAVPVKFNFCPAFLGNPTVKQ